MSEIADLIADSRNMRTRIESASLPVAQPNQPAGIMLPGRVAMFRLVSVSDDTISCYEWNGTTAGTILTTIAKPEELRKTPWHGKTISGKTYTYTATQARTVVGSVTENQIIIPTYQIAVTNYSGSIIFAVRPLRGTGVTGVVWQDLNVAGRAWAEVTT